MLPTCLATTPATHAQPGLSMQLRDMMQSYWVSRPFVAYMAGRYKGESQRQQLMTVHGDGGFPQQAVMQHA